MKRVRIYLCILIMIIASMALVACGEESYEGEETSDAEAYNAVEIAAEEVSDESVVLGINQQAEDLIDNRQAYLDDLQFKELADEAEQILNDGADVLDSENQEALEDLQGFATSLDNIHEADYSFEKGEDNTEADYETLQDSSFCTEEMYDALTKYSKFNNQRWKRKDIVKDDYGTDRTTYMVTAFESFQLKDEAAGFTPDNIEPVTCLRVKYDDKGDVVKGRGYIDTESMLDSELTMEMDDGSECVLEIDKKKEISMHYAGKIKTLSNVVTAANKVVHKKDKTTKTKSTSGQTSGNTSDKIVYITETGEKYHESWCSYLRQSKIEITKSEAKALGYEPCSRCRP